MDEAFVQDAEDDVDDDDGQQQQQAQALARTCEGLGGAVEAGLGGGGQADLALQFADAADRLAQGKLAAQVEP